MAIYSEETNVETIWLLLSHVTDVFGSGNVIKVEFHGEVVIVQN
jgi:hypothetical protein